MLGAVLAPGSTIGHYRILRQIDEGGMGAVYAAQHIHTEDRVAIKVLIGPAARNAEVLQRFHNEAKATARLKHERIVRVTDYGKTSETADGEWYIVMEYLEGAPLSRLIAAGPIEPRRVVKLIGQACAALQFAHDRGVIHRDVKPANLFVVGAGGLDADEHVKLLDFGIAKVRDALQTKSRVLMGTPPYMAPEQLRDSKKIDARADVYALGVIAYEATTGVRPWGDQFAEVVIHDIQTTQTHLLDPRNAPLPPGQLRPEIGEAWALAILRALHPDPEQRWQTPRDLALALARAALPTPWAPDAMDVLREHAKELTTIPVHSDTVGRPLHGDWRTPPGTPVVPTAPARPAHPASASTPLPAGLPTPVMPGHLAASYDPGASRATGAPVATMPTTLGSSAVQTYQPADPRRRRVWLGVTTIGGAALLTTIALGIYSSRNAASPRPRAEAPGAARTSTLPPPDAAHAMSALAIVSEPEGALISVDRVTKGTAPINVPVPVGSEVVVTAELAGYASTSQTVRVGAEPAAVRVRLGALDAGAAPPPPVTPTNEKHGPAHTKSSGHREDDPPTSAGAGSLGRGGPGSGSTSGSAGSTTGSAAGSGTAAGSAAPTYNPDDLPD